MLETILQGVTLALIFFDITKLQIILELCKFLDSFFLCVKIF